MSEPKFVIISCTLARLFPTKFDVTWTKELDENCPSSEEQTVQGGFDWWPGLRERPRLGSKAGLTLSMPITGLQSHISISSSFCLFEVHFKMASGSLHDPLQLNMTASPLHCVERRHRTGWSEIFLFSRMDNSTL